MKPLKTLALTIGLCVSTIAYSQKLEPIKIKKGDILDWEKAQALNCCRYGQVIPGNYVKTPHDFNQNGKVDHIAIFPINSHLKIDSLGRSLYTCCPASEVYQLRKEFKPRKGFYYPSIKPNNIKRAWFDLDKNGTLETQMNRKKYKKHYLAQKKNCQSK